MQLDTKPGRNNKAVRNASRKSETSEVRLLQPLNLWKHTIDIHRKLAWYCIKARVGAYPHRHLWLNTVPLGRPAYKRALQPRCSHGNRGGDPHLAGAVSPYESPGASRDAKARMRLRLGCSRLVAARTFPARVCAEGQRSTGLPAPPRCRSAPRVGLAAGVVKHAGGSVLILANQIAAVEPLPRV